MTVAAQPVIRVVADMIDGYIGKATAEDKMNRGTALEVLEQVRAAVDIKIAVILADMRR